MVKLVVCDWNRTLFQDPYESVFFSGLIKRFGLRRSGWPQRLSFFGLLHLKQIVLLGNYFVSGETHLRDKRKLIEEILHLLNSNVIRDIDASILNEYIEQYALSVQIKLDKRILIPLSEVKREHGFQLIVMSSGCAPAIRRILEIAAFPVDQVVGNEFNQIDGKIKEFKLRIFGNKSIVLQSLLDKLGIKWAETLFIGDDVEDENCFKLAGFPVVAFSASARSRRYLMKAANACVPTNASEFTRLLRMWCRQVRG